MSSRIAASFSLAVLVATIAACTSSAPTPTSAPPTSRPTTGPSTPALSPSPLPSPTPAPPTPSPTGTPSATLILQVTNEGGFIAPTAHLAEIPAVSVYDDGTIITPVIPSGDVTPLVSQALIRYVGPTGAAAILAAIKRAGLDTAQQGGPGGVPGDSGTTVFRVSLDGTTTTSRFVQAGGGPGGPGGPGHPGASEAPDAEATAAFDLLGRLDDATDDWGGRPDTGHAYPATAYRIFAAPVGPSSTTESPGPVAWPLDTPLSAFGTPAVPDRGVTGLRSGVVFGVDAQLLAPVLVAASQSTLFSSGGRDWQLYIRPLLPDELAG